MAGNRQLLALKNAAAKAAQLRWDEAMRWGRRGAFGAFCEYFIRITTPVPGERVPFVWNAIQRRFCARRTGWDIVLKARQVGLTTLEIARDLWFALVRPGVAVAVVVQPHKENLPRRKVVATIKDLIRRTGRPLGDEWAGSTCRFANGSSVTVLDAGGSEESASKMGRGGTYHRVHVTELAHFPYAGALLEALLAAVPPPERGGEFTVESTPRGVGGAFHDMWNGAVSGANGLTPHFFGWFWLPAYSVPGPGAGDPADPAGEEETALVAEAARGGCALTQGQLAWWRRMVATLGLRTVLQEYPADPVRCFLLAGGSYFDRPAVDRLEQRAKGHTPRTVEDLRALARAQASQGRGVAPYTARLSAFLAMVNRGHKLCAVWEPPEPGCEYLVAVDAAGGGVGGDNLAAVVLNRKTRHHVATLRARVPPPDFARWVHALALAYGQALIAVERNAHGGTVIHVLEHELEYPHLWRDHRGVIGWYTGPHNRMPAVDTLADAILHDAVHTVDPWVISEARTFVRTKGGKIEADRGCTDDVIMAMVIAWAVVHGPRSPARGMRPSTVAQAAP